ncbi:TPA: sigma 54-interacting transcriptional regulator [Clostridioides difficile]|uniref:Sigma 54-interacting transcriptional regulator n=6 Tax=Clostridioides difficile TaxID=1496 RepID=A0AAN5VLR2_CLODI|nr:sigma 54-interacting transcriptional regulator [Clostridioides difficile]EHJ35646.1 PAS domain S-box protein [Clostridioides difficile 70-100-2010]EQI79893.1 sensory box protein [Clostridioides difficile Y401]CCL42677.1 Transcriptional regulator, sigma-54-dependent [Clostridioides difficile E24]CCL46699.1 Transcriptional regulator, sigma-54-dependent [Clostridioides difficile T42]CCL49792.1 Transcriptional regulator, sigma-54-dependent [Clostridioides difficile T6]CCL57868.1 Transcriptiona
MILLRKKIGIIASDIELKERIEELYREDVENGTIIIDILNLDLMENQGRILVEKGAQAIIGRGGGYSLVIDTVNVPVIPMNMKSTDLLRAIEIAKKYSKKVVLILGDNEVSFDYVGWRNVISTEITEEWFESKYEIRSKVVKYIDQKDEIVIVGGGLACSFARQYGIDSVFATASDESIREAVEYCKKLLDTLGEEKFNNEVLRNILDGIKDGVIAIDSNGSIILYNESAKNMLKVERKCALNKYILDVFPKMEWMLDCLHEKEDVEDRKIRNINNLIVNTRTTLIKVDNSTYGVLGIIQDITKLQNLERKIRFDLNQKGLYARYTFDDFLFKDKLTKEFIEEAKKIGKSDYTTLLYGESGSGKEIIAHSIHNISKRKDRPFVAINCATIAENLLESELFGYEEGAFTGARKGGKRGLFELAHGGTLFLDEINSLSFNIQTKLLRVIEERQIMRIGSDYIIPLDIRIIAATNESLTEKIVMGTFRADLFYRLSSLEINIPPLRDRREDIIPLFNNFVNEVLKDDGLNGINSIDENFVLTKDEMDKLYNYSWPGNVRELKTIAQKYVVTGKIKLRQDRDFKTKKLLPNSEVDKFNSETTASVEVQDESINISKINDGKISIDIKEVNKYVEEKIISMLFAQGLSKNEVAQVLGISRTSLWKKYNKNI